MRDRRCVVCRKSTAPQMNPPASCCQRRAAGVLASSCNWHRPQHLQGSCRQTFTIEYSPISACANSGSREVAMTVRTQKEWQLVACELKLTGGGHHSLAGGSKCPEGCRPS